MISASFLWRNMLLGGELQIDAKKSNFEIFENTLYTRSGRVPSRHICRFDAEDAPFFPKVFDTVVFFTKTKQNKPKPKPKPNQTKTQKNIQQQQLFIKLDCKFRQMTQMKKTMLLKFL